MRPGARTNVGPPSRFLESRPRPGPRPRPELGFGGWAVGGSGWGAPTPERERLAAIERAIERGITFFDTAPTYGAGASESLLGRVLGPYRERVTIATKVGPRDDPRASLEASLSRLATDYVDLVQLHEYGDRWESQIEQLNRLQDEGKARAIGACNATHLQLARALEIAAFHTYQGPYNLFDRDVEERHLPLCSRRGIAFLAYRPLASGLLGGGYQEAPAPAPAPTFPEGDHRRNIFWFKGAEFDRRRAAIARLEGLARARGTSLAALALGWVLARPGVAIVLAGARTARQVNDNVSAVEHPLSAEEVAQVDAIVAAVFPPRRATATARRLAAGWGARERYIVEQLDGSRTYEAIAAGWTDRGEQPMIAAQVKVFCDQLAEQGLVE
ncbi:MAG TPA: aldo/keto reductase [Gemmatimonadales bacterium]|nr:aldo/keto reductase [Gemmatimonadales bacterium]